MNKDKKKELLNGIKNKALNLYAQSYDELYSPNYNVWKSQSEMILMTIFGEKSKHVKDFEHISYSLLCFTTGTPDSEFVKAYNKGLDQAVALIDSFIEILDLLEDNKVVEKNSSKGDLGSKEVFIVHGRDNETKLEVARYLEHLNLKPIILHEQANNGKTIVEKIEGHTNVKYGIVLYTPCDIGGFVECKEQGLKKRARQNVVFEHGFLMGKLGRANVAAVVKGDIETPNDIAGVVYISMNDSQWKIDLGKELKSAGYEIDFNKLI